MKRMLLFCFTLSILSLGAQDAYHRDLQAALSNDYNLPTGDWMFYDNESDILNNATAYGCSQTIQTVMNQPFGMQAALSVGSAGSTPFSSGWNIRNQIAVQQGDVVLAVFHMRAIGGKGKVNFFAENATTFFKEVFYTMPIDTQWREYLVPIEMQNSYATGSLVFGFHLGHQAQMLEVGGFTAISFKQNASLSQLPNQVNNRFYEGWEANAAWRSAAANRIDQVRKANLTVKVEDTNGNPLDGANVQVSMLRHEFAFGSAITAQRIAGNNDYNRIYESKITNLDGKGHGFNWVVFENDLKWPAWESGWFVSKPEIVNAVSWLRQRNIKIRGHTLVWPGFSNMPNDIAANINDLNYVKNRVNNHIKAILEYPGIQGEIEEWDVINEIMTNTDLETSFRGSNGYPTGREILAEIFQQTKSVDSLTGLWLNDYITLSQQQEAGSQQYDDLKRNIGELLQAGVDLEGLGFQGHIGGFPNGIPAVLNTLDDFYQAYGLKAKITEFDLPTFVTDSIAAAYMKDFMTAIFSHPSMDGFLAWSFWDGASWINASTNIFDINWNMTLPGSTYVDLVFDEWWTEETLAADAAGEAQVRAFKGLYEIAYICDGVWVRDTVDLISDQTYSISCDRISTSLQENAALSAQIYPNPTSKAVFIDLSYTAPSSVQITDLQGKTVRSYETTEAVTQLDISDIAQGVYIISVSNSKGNYRQKLIVK